MLLYYLQILIIEDNNTDKVIMAVDLRDRLACYQQGAMGNYSTAFSVVLKKKSADLFETAKQVRKQIRQKMNNPKDLYLVLQCYAELDKELLDATFASAQVGLKARQVSSLERCSSDLISRVAIVLQILEE